MTLRGPETKATIADCPAGGEWIGIAAQSEIEADGVGQSHATLFDAEGAVARALVSLLVERRPR